VSTSNTSESFEIYIGDGAETIKSAKLLYLGFKNATEVPRNLKAQITVSTPNIIPTFKDKDVNFGINYYNLTAKSISGNVTVNVSISNNGTLKISDMLYAVELFTNNSNLSSIIYTNGNSSISNTVNSRFSYNMVSKNLNATEKDKYSVKLYDSQNNDITSKFNIKKDDFAFDTSKITLIQKEALSTNNITLKTIVGSTVSTKNINISSTGYTFNGLLVDETNMIIYGVSPNMTVSEFLSKINGGTKTVYNASGTAVSTTSNMGTGYTVKINYNNNDYIYNISILGDVNSDGKVNISDVMKIATQITKGKQITKQMELDASDVTKDDKINISDVMKVATYIVKKVGL
jgi:endoglucanase